MAYRFVSMRSRNQRTQHMAQAALQNLKNMSLYVAFLLLVEFQTALLQNKASLSACRYINIDRDWNRGLLSNSRTLKSAQLVNRFIYLPIKHRLVSRKDRPPSQIFFVVRHLGFKRILIRIETAKQTALKPERPLESPYR